MKNKIFISVSLLILFLVGFFFFVNTEKHYQDSANELSEFNQIKIAACPTCFELLASIDASAYEVIRTNSTAESIALLQDKKVDMILAGRTLKPYEPHMDSLLVKEGYSFLSNQEGTVYLNELKDEYIYTDLDIETMQIFFPFQKIEWVENVYEYLNRGIVITSWENSDYTKATILHVLEEYGERVSWSRQPTIYCPNFCGPEAYELAWVLQQ
jgi:hypothetical protein